VTATAQTPENRTVKAKTWVWIWNNAASGTTRTRRPRSSPTRRPTRWAIQPILLLVTGLPESWAVVTAEGDTVQSRQLLHATGESFAFDVPITRLAQPNLVISA
jgi:alpha-2-macroglobulin